IAATSPSGIRSLMNLGGLRNGKYDMNNNGAVSTDFIGMNYDYPEGDYATREAIVAAHRNYQQGLLYFLASDPSVPQQVRDEMSSYGLTADEFPELDGWSGGIYVREARRMVGPYVMTDRDCLDYRDAPEPIGLGSYNMDSHNTQRYVDASGHARNEGDIQKSVPQPYEISYLSLTPDEAEASNLLVTGAVSASHIAYGSIRMEPVFMVLGQAAGTAAAMALDGGTSVQGVDYLLLRERLIADGALVQWPNNGVVYRGVVAADFNDYTAFPVDLRYKTGGVGFDGPWDGTGTESVHAGDLTYSRGGYAIAQGGPGAAGKVQAHYYWPRQNYRSLAGDMGGEVWFSVLLHNPDDGSVCGLTFNPTGNADPNSDSVRHGVQIVGDQLRVILAGSTTSPVATLALDQTHLLLGRMVLEGGPDTFELWADPDDLSDLGPADFVEDGVDFFDLLSKVAVFGYNPEGPFNQPWRTNGGYIDALRLSNREGMGVAFRDVTGVPEPGALVMLTLAIPAVVRRRSRRGCPSRRARRRRG
ncbi:MAG TPA: FAD-dependent oxidoreductase, partial [Phycisphaerae bacterium]|nr:FAD-dependent oxidoreductase [Phycisphaerae bacterium]